MKEREKIAEACFSAWIEKDKAKLGALFPKMLFDCNDKITYLKEYQSKIPNVYPYE